MSRSIKSIAVQRFKSLEDVTLELGDRLTVLVGPNNAGKSSLLQAIQFGVSVVQSAGMDGAARWTGEALSATLATDQLVYTPLRDIHMLAKGGALRQDKGKAIVITVAADDGVAEISVRRGKNKNIAVRCHGRDLGWQIQQLESPFSVIAPGLAGIPSYEEFKSEGIVRRAAARGDANNVFRNVLWILRNDAAGWKHFQDRLHQVFPDVHIDVTFDASSDEHLRATITRDGTVLPIDASGTGILQAAQVLAYIGVYSPRLLILDEPDAHLHPDNQRKLVRLLNEVADDDGVQVLMSTHSRHMLDEGVSVDAAVHWVCSGGISDAPFDVVDSLMALGALDAGDRLRAGATKWVVLTEDSNTEPVKTILRANGFSDTSVDVWSYASSSQVPAATALGRFITEHAPGTRVLVHCDRDYLGGDELDAVFDRLRKAGLFSFTTPGTDIESFFLAIDHLLAVYSDKDPEEVRKLIADATIETRHDSLKALINARVTAANRRRKEGEKQPDAGEIAVRAQRDLDADPERYRHGKKVLKRLNALAQERFGKARSVFTASNALAVQALQDLQTAESVPSPSEMDGNATDDSNATE
ncbi:AAA family ATPase [Georgenia muralis]|uniref:Putative ATPase n=1 Tax=Georgenia muralis TaxID=154117 RepID=A0A3N4Z4N2_9MICO|nr:ATP-binding protein [Georgenia muralis]RPF26666.1 putative ATPase [Georgenia muralis]